MLERATAALIGVNFAQNGCDWVIHQVASLRTERPGLPIILMLEPDDTSRADALARQLNYKATSPHRAPSQSLRRLCAWSWPALYFPATHDASPRKTSVEATVSSFDYRFASTRLTPREEAVLSVLASGAQNKIIAYQLSMCCLDSTVKAHVHSIIQKLKVRNRTEVVVAAQNMLVHKHEAYPKVHHRELAPTAPA